MRQSSEPQRDIVSAALIIGAALLAWEVAVRLSRVPVYIAPPPSMIARKLWQEAPHYLGAAWVTLAEALSGLLLGLSVGVGVATLITFWTNLERGILALAILIKATPMVAIAPLLIIWFGFGPLPKIIITAILTFFPVLVNVYSGLHAVDEAMLALFHSLDASRWELFRHARWPSALPICCRAEVVAPPRDGVAEARSAGLGRAMWLAHTVPALFAAIFCSAVMGIGLYAAVIAVEKRHLLASDAETVERTGLAKKELL